MISEYQLPLLYFLGINFIIKLVRCHQTGLFECNHICLLWEGPNAVYCHVSRRCLQHGKVMGVRYPGLVSRHNLVCPWLVLRALVPVWDRFCFATTVAVDAFGR